MSSGPQLEDGHVRLATELLLALARAGMTARQWPIVMVIARKTYGYQKKVDDIGLSQLSELTGIAKPHVSVAVRELADRRIITRKTGAFGHILGINKNYAQWLPSGKSAACLPVVRTRADSDARVTDSVAVTDSVTVTESVTGGLPNQYLGGYRIGKAGVTESVTTIDNPTKENHQKKKSCASQAKRDSEKGAAADREDRAITSATSELQDRFARFYAAYPKKKSRAAAEKAFGKLHPDEQLLADMIAGIERAMKAGHWSDPQFIPYPASWLNAAGWLDEIQTDYSDAERAVIQVFNDILGGQLGEIPDAPFVESRAAAIREFFTFSPRPALAERFFGFVRENGGIPPNVGFDWLITRAGFTKTSGIKGKSA